MNAMLDQMAGIRETLSERLEGEVPEHLTRTLIDRLVVTAASAEFLYLLWVRESTQHPGAPSTARVLDALVALLEGVLSTAGFALDYPTGWLVDAWMGEETREHVVALWAQRPESALISAVSAIVVALQAESPDDGGLDCRRQQYRALEIVRGHDILESVAPRAEAMHELVRAHVQSLAARPGMPSEELILGAMSSPRWMDAGITRLALRTAPIIELQEGSAPFPGAAPTDPADREADRWLQHSLRMVKRRPPALAPLRVCDDGVVTCSRCNTTLPLADSERALSACTLTACPECSLLLSPFDITWPAERTILRHAVSDGAHPLS
jgi:hypothetical protein